MEKIDIHQLNNGSKVRARFARRDTEDGCSPDWGEPKIVTLYVQKLEKDYGRGKNLRKAGTIVGLTVQDFSWAEYGEEDFCEEFNEFLAEEYRMQILEIL